MLRVSVVIATYNRRRLLERTLPRLLNQDFPRDQYEVIVVVDGSTDGTIDYLRTLKAYSHLVVVEQTNQGQAAAINAGLHVARGEIVLFLDDDILCGPGLVAAHAQSPREGKLCLAFGPVFIDAEARDDLAADWARTFCDDFFATRVHEAPQRGWYGCLASANSSAPLAVLQDLGGLDPSYSRKNDIELGHRALEAGYRFVFLPSAITHQIFEKTRHDVIDDARGEGSAEVRLCRKFPKLRSTARFASLGSRSAAKRVIARLISTFPVSVGALLTPLVWLCDQLRMIPRLRRAALHLLQAQQNVAAYRSATREAGSWQSLEHMFAPRLPVLMYHSIGPLRPGFDRYLTISPEMFEGDLQWLKNHGYTPIRCVDWVACVREGKELQPKPVLLTFDDAYRDLATFGLPLLKKYGFTGTVFVVTDQIGRTNEWDLHLGLSEQPLMSADEIRHWFAEGIEFGSHSRTHADLRTLSNAQLEDEFGGSRRALEQLISSPVVALAYPYGYYNGAVIEAARQNFDLALTCDSGLNSPAVDPLRMRRATVVPEFRLGARAGVVGVGFNPLLIAWIQSKLLAKRLLRWKTRGLTPT